MNGRRGFGMVAVALLAAMLLGAGCGKESGPTGFASKGLVKATVTVGGTSLAGAAVFIDGAYAGTSGTDGSFAIDLAPGQHTVWLVVRGQATQRAVITVNDEEQAFTFTVSMAIDGSLALEVTAISAAALPIIEADDSLEALRAAVEALDGEAFAGENRQAAYLNKIGVVIKNFEKGNFKGALAKLTNDVAAKADGCAATGAPDANDWVTDCAAQRTLEPLIAAALDDLAAATEGD